MKLDKFTEAYIECALWSSTDDKDEAMDTNYSVSDIAEETLAEMVNDCASFQSNNEELLDAWYSIGKESSERAGHDFWLTRNRHGAGFWDRWSDSTPAGKIGRKLTEIAHAFGSVDLYIGDDGKVYGN